MVGEHDGGRLIEWDGGEDTCPLIRCDAVCGIGDDVPGEAFEGFVKEGESDRSCIVGDYGPVPLIVSNLGNTNFSPRIIFARMQY